MIQFAGSSINDPWHDEQWQYIRKNIGEWHGWFRQFSPEAVWERDTPSTLTLREDCLNQHMTLVLKRTPEGMPTQTMERDLGFPGAAPYLCFFPTGAFSQGAPQRRPWSSFGAEFSLLSEQRRLRLVQLYKGTANGDHVLEYVTLIPEYRSTGRSERTLPDRYLQLNDFLGTWRGESLYLPATMVTPQLGTSYWQAQDSEAELVISDKTFIHEAVQSFQPIDPHRWQAGLVQYWLLPGNVSCTVYPQLPRNHCARLEFCWYLLPHRRQRIVRDYDEQGNWIGTFLSLETRV
ncbi:MAG: DUF3598 family protein [Cyanobacteria bacterium P01_D01_bin.156]